MKAIYRSKKEEVQVWRNISLWDHHLYYGTDEKENLRIRNTEGISTLKDKQDSLAVEILTQAIPEWKEMSNIERMKTLDTNFEHYALQIYQK